MDKMSESQEKKLFELGKFKPEDMPQIRMMVKEVKAGLVSQEAAAEKYKVTRHQIRKWVGLLQDLIFIQNENQINEVLKSKIMHQLITGELSQKEVAKKFNVDVSL